jgi:hypothetical protein
MRGPQATEAPPAELEPRLLPDSGGEQGPARARAGPVKRLEAGAGEEGEEEEEDDGVAVWERAGRRGGRRGGARGEGGEAGRE